MRFLLLVADSVSSYWVANLAEAAAPLGELAVIESGKAMEYIIDTERDVIMLDSSLEGDVIEEVTRLRAEKPGCRVVVVTASPTWERARAAFRAGAVDYLPNTLSVKELRDSLEQFRQKPPPPPRP
jgi:response regulator of citrate/malate metabolism